MVWISLIPFMFGVIDFIFSIAKACRNKVSYDNEICSILWFILAVLVYGVFK